MMGNCSWCKSRNVEIIEFEDIDGSTILLCPYCSLNYPNEIGPNTLRCDLSRMLNLLEKRLKTNDIETVIPEKKRVDGFDNDGKEMDHEELYMNHGWNFCIEAIRRNLNK